MFGWLKRLGTRNPEPSAMRVVTANDYRIQMDLSSQVLLLHTPDSDVVNACLTPTPARGAGFTSAALLAHKAKQFDDGMYAAVELAMEDGAGDGRGKRWLLETLADALANLRCCPDSSVPGVIYGSALLGGLRVTTPTQLEASVNEMVSRFRASPRLCQPLSFYTWAEDLRRIFLQDRMLQQELTGASEIRALVEALRGSGAEAVYRDCLKLTAGLTNPPPAEIRDLRVLLNDSAGTAPDRGLYFFPPSRSPEAELLKTISTNRPMTNDLELTGLMIDSLRSGSYDARPHDDSGWYDFQFWALEPLVAFDRMPERPRMKFTRGYARHLEGLFRSLAALARETHVKQLEMPTTCALIEPASRTIHVCPELSVEPVYSYYLRRAASYWFLGRILEKQLGKAVLSGLRRLRADGPSNRDVWTDLEEISGLFYGASVMAARELGYTEQERRSMEASISGVVPALCSDADIARFVDWAHRCDEDSDLSQDARMMVPLYHDPARGKTKVLAFLGWSSRKLEVSFASAPALKVFDDRGRRADGKISIVLDSQTYRLASPVSVELYVSRILDRREFRDHCDRFESAEAIVGNLR